MIDKSLRTVLFVPGNKPRMLAKARDLPADAVILDLEDGVPPGEKEVARAHVRQALDSEPFGPTVIVRPNGFDTGLTRQDLEATLMPGIDAVCLPKARTAAEVERLDALLVDLELAAGYHPGQSPRS